ncbi:hypothetical protein BH11PLA1_BH11PLA1_14390 [soil metagenome]
MVNMLHIWMAVGAAALCLAAEWVHARRVKRARYLAFPMSGGPRRWTHAVPFTRALACGLVVFGLLTLMSTDGRPALGADALAGKPPDRHLIIVMDVSPSMEVKDAGDSGKMARRARARDVLESLLTRLDMTRTRASLIAFWDDAKPVVIDTFDMNIIANAVGDLPLGYAFKGGKTDLWAGVREACKIAAPWPAGSGTLIIVSDGGDPGTTGAIPALPPGIGDALVLGVGSPFRSSPVGDTTTRQDRESLDRLATRLRGRYFDANAKHLPSGVLSSLRMLNLEGESRVALRVIALVCIAAGAGLLAGVSPLLALLGAPATGRPATRGRVNQQSDVAAQRAAVRGDRNPLAEITS